MGVESTEHLTRDYVNAVLIWYESGINTTRHSVHAMHLGMSMEAWELKLLQSFKKCFMSFMWTITKSQKIFWAAFLCEIQLISLTFLTLNFTTKSMINAIEAIFIVTTFSRLVKMIMQIALHLTLLCITYFAVGCLDAFQSIKCFRKFPSKVEEFLATWEDYSRHFTMLSDEGCGETPTL